MRALVVILVIVIFAAAAWHFLSPSPLTPMEERAQAQSSEVNLMQYFCDAFERGNLGNMEAVCIEPTKKQARFAYDELRRQATLMGAPCNSCTRMTMGSPGAYKMVLGSDSGILMQAIVRCAKKDDKFWIVEVTPD